MEGGEQNMDDMGNIDMNDLVESASAEDAEPVSVGDIMMEKIHQYPRF